MKRLAIIYGTDGEYIREVLSFFQLGELRRGGDRKYIAFVWGAGEKDRRAVWSVNDRYEIEVETSDGLPTFEEAVVLNLPAPAERSFHRNIAGHLRKKNAVLFNPYPASRLAGDKSLAISKMAEKNIPVPESVLLRRSDSSKVIPRLKAFLAAHKAAGFFVQPNEGTEGRETYFFPAREFRRSPGLAAETVSGILRDRDVIVKKARGNVFYHQKEEEERGYRPVTFRVFLWQPEDKVESDLGFAEISASENDPITSPEKGGRITTPAEAMANLWYRGAGGFHRLVLTEEEVQSLPATAVRALAALNSGLRRKLRIAGVDLLLEVTRGKIRPVVLEINPRPSGLDKVAEFSPSRSLRSLPT